MNPAGHQGEPAPLQGRYDGIPGQPGGPAVVQHTTVNISSEPPKDHIIWSLYCFVYSNPFCLGLAALIFSIKARDRRMAGDLDGAQHYASKARCLNIWATVIGSIIIICSFIIMLIALARDRRMAGDLDGARHYASKARCLNIWATVIGSIIIICSFISLLFLLYVYLLHNQRS